MRLLRMSVGVAIVGLTVGCSASSGASASSAASASSPSAPKKDPDVISAAEISAQSFRDGYDIVQRLRPTWFTRKSGGSTARRMGTSPSASAIGAGLLVYLDNTRMGGVDALRQMSAASIGSMKFLDAATATATLPGIGSSVVSGAIVVRTQGLR